jgi:hypothetical protein
MSSPRTVVFDLGGVLLRWQPDLLIREVLAGRNDQAPAADVVLAGLFETSYLTGDWADFDRGRYSIDGLVHRICARSGLPDNLVPAKALGWPGIHFVDADRCAADLERLGWL